MSSKYKANSSGDVSGMIGIIPRKHYFRRAATFLRRVSVPAATATAAIAFTGGAVVGLCRLGSGPPTNYSTSAVNIMTHSSYVSADSNDNLYIPVKIFSKSHNSRRGITVSVYNRTNHQEQVELLIYTDANQPVIHGSGGEAFAPTIKTGQGSVSPPQSNEIKLQIPPLSSESTTFYFNRNNTGYVRAYTGNTYQAEVGF